MAWIKDTSRKFCGPYDHGHPEIWIDFIVLTTSLNRDSIGGICRDQWSSGDEIYLHFPALSLCYVRQKFHPPRVFVRPYPTIPLLS